MKKLTTIALVVTFLIIAPIALATFTANGNVTISDVTYTGYSPVDFTILNTSTSDSFTYNSGVFTVTNPGTPFRVACSDATVKAFEVTGPVNLCEKNTTPGTTYVTLPTTAGTYTVLPNNTDLPNATAYNSSCGASACLAGYTVVGSGSSAGCCQTVSNASTYNAYPTCGAASCQAGYTLSGSGATATCVHSTSGGTGLPAEPDVTPVCQTYDPTTGELRECTTEEEQVTEEADGQIEGVSTTPGVPEKDDQGNVTLAQLAYDAETIYSGDVERITSEMGYGVDPNFEAQYQDIVSRVIGDTDISQTDMDKIRWFIAYGTKSTKFLGAGERGGVVNSFKAAFGRLPTTLEDWKDIIKIALGRWPTQHSEAAENKAKITFQAIYLRIPDMNNQFDNAAVTVMAYGLRPAQRNMNSENQAILNFRAIFGYGPSSATDWDAVRAIAYSGARR